MSVLRKFRFASPIITHDARALERGRLPVGSYAHEDLYRLPRDRHDDARAPGWCTGPVEAATPTIVLVHGTFAKPGSWNGVIERLGSDGYTVIAVAQ